MVLLGIGKGHHETGWGSKAMNDTLETSYRVTADELRQFIERYERLDQEKKDMAIEETREYMYTPPKYTTAGRTNKKPTSP